MEGILSIESKKFGLKKHNSLIIINVDSTQLLIKKKKTQKVIYHLQLEDLKIEEPISKHQKIRLIQSNNK